MHIEGRQENGLAASSMLVPAGFLNCARAPRLFGEVLYALSGM